MKDFEKFYQEILSRAQNDSAYTAGYGKQPLSIDRQLVNVYSL